MDVLSDILDLLQFRGSLYFVTEFSPPWGVQVPAYQNVARFHLAIGGECWVKVEGVEKPVLLSPGDMIIIPHGKAHVLLDKLDTPPATLDAVLETSGFTGEGHLIYGGNDDGMNKLVCGHFQFDQNFHHPLISELPDYILISGKQALDFSWFEQAMRFMSYESQSSNMGNEVIIKHLSEILFIHAVRVWNKFTGHEKGFLKAVADRHIGRSLKAFHQKPADTWTIELLAAEAGLSRSVFADRFRYLMQTTPMHYVTMWRMQKACNFLIQNDMPTDLIAEEVGYQSLAAFSKVFKKTIGIGPGKYRKDHSLLNARAA
ncbi:AraC family transcriptional regulator [Kordiimonas aquimaris]|uniref:AraC family transcriptional regulator n=1 Tax=Kordiimonas aquimaris TaxID=707591 RepID=UPI0021CEC1A5|nr:AraC family transcriptional regulator [Kordiimonas aquimaris]